MCHQLIRLRGYALRSGAIEVDASIQLDYIILKFRSLLNLLEGSKA